jgi:hypothetical protein
VRVASHGVVGEWMSARPAPAWENGAADEDEAPASPRFFDLENSEGDLNSTRVAAARVTTAVGLT